jgi:hypothetical protein
MKSGAITKSAARAHTENRRETAPVNSIQVLPPESAPRSNATCACGGSCPRCHGHVPVQTKLRIHAPGDAFEREADRVAAAVVRGAVLAPQLTASHDRVQRLSSDDSPSEEDAVRGVAGTDEEEEVVPVQRLQALGSAHPNRTSIATLPTAGGAPLSSPVAQTLGVRMGADFSHVRVHNDATAARLASDLSARAFTSGAHIYFAAGEYRPHTHAGAQVLAHELTHVVQQGAAARTAAAPISHSPAAPAVQRMSVLDHSSAANVAATHVQPWPSLADAVGNDYWVQTDAGNDVKAWVPYSDVPSDHRYWCHGFSLGTYNRWMYSVYSGANMARVVTDEYRVIPNVSASAGDLAVWTLMPDGRTFGHSAKFTSATVSGGALDEGRSTLNSKNGPNHLGSFSLTQLIATYGSGYEVFRQK